MPATNQEIDGALAHELSELQSEKIRRADAREILEIVNTIIESMNRDIPSIDISVREDLRELANYIRATKQEILDLRPEEISEEHLPAASMELDAIVTATEDATHSIMEAAEKIEAVGADTGGDIADRLVDATTQIYEACGFQDITGQRIGKIVRALREIEVKVDDLIQIFVEDEKARERRALQRAEPGVDDRQEAASDSNLLEGPQLPEDAISQDDIDALFANDD